MASTEDRETMKRMCDGIIKYLKRVQDFSPGEYYGSFWSEKAYHAPLLDYNAGGSHHNRGAGSAALALWLAGRRDKDDELMRRAEAAFDWLAARQHERGGYHEIQNNERPSDWELTGLEELSTIETGFVIHGLCTALLHGLPPKKSYYNCVRKAGLWFLSLEFPQGSGLFPHHERSPHDTLNATMHAVEALSLAYWVTKTVFNKPIDIFFQGACRGIRHTLPLQWANGCYPYRIYGYSTINYTSLVLWCLLNVIDVLPAEFRRDRAVFWDFEEGVNAGIEKASAFLRGCVDGSGQLLWEGNETSAKYNMWTYLITINVLSRIGGRENAAVAGRLLEFVKGKLTSSGLLPLRDRGEEITECAFMQADMLLFLLPLLDRQEKPEGRAP